MRPDRWRGVALLGAAIASEVGGTMLLHAAEGLTRPPAAVGALAGYVVSILLFSRALTHGLALGVAYGTLTGVGLASATALSAAAFGDPLHPAQAAGLVVILAGTLLLQRA